MAAVSSCFEVFDLFQQRTFFLFFVTNLYTKKMLFKKDKEKE